MSNIKISFAEPRANAWKLLLISLIYRHYRLLINKQQKTNSKFQIMVKKQITKIEKPQGKTSENWKIQWALFEKFCLIIFFYCWFVVHLVWYLEFENWYLFDIWILIFVFLLHLIIKCILHAFALALDWTHICFVKLNL